MYKPSTKPVTLTRPTPYSTVQAEAGAWTVVGLAVAFLFHSIFVFGYLPAPSRALSLESRRRTNHYQSGQPSAYISHCSPPVRSWRSCFEAAVTRDTSPQHLAPPGGPRRSARAALVLPHVRCPAVGVGLQLYERPYRFTFWLRAQPQVGVHPQCECEAQPSRRQHLRGS